MLDPTAVQRFRSLVSEANLSLANFDLHLEKPASCGAEGAAEALYRVRYRPSGVARGYPAKDGSAWIERFAKDLAEGLFVTRP